jgi:hypothetical protein
MIIYVRAVTRADSGQGPPDVEGANDLLVAGHLPTGEDEEGKAAPVRG